MSVGFFRNKTNRFDDLIVICDEVHNLLGGEDWSSTTKGLFNNLASLFRTAKNFSGLFVTATPIIKAGSNQVEKLLEIVPYSG